MAGYMALLRRLRKAKGSRARALRRRAVRYRRKMIRANPVRRHRKQRRHTAYRQSVLNAILKLSQTRKGRGKYKQFWGVDPDHVNIIPAPGKMKVLVSAGTTPGVYLSDCPRDGAGCKQWKVPGRRRIAFDTSGRRIYILAKGSQKNFGKGLKFVGYAHQSVYVPTKAMERAGSHKKNRIWIHRMGEEGGTWPKVYKDKAGNFIYARGTYRIGKWIRD